MGATKGCRSGNVRVNNKYVGGVLTSLNGYSGTGLLCNKGERLYDISVKRPFFFVPEDTPIDETFCRLTQEAAPGVMPYYAISNYGRLMNTYSGKVMKENVRPTGYGYFCLASEKGQSKYTTHQMVAKTFLENPDSEHNTQVDHINNNKLDNYVNKRMEDGSLKTNLKWVTPADNVQKAHNDGLCKNFVIDENIARDICERLEKKETAYSISKSYPGISYATISLVKRRKTWTKVSKDYKF